MNEEIPMGDEDEMTGGAEILVTLSTFAKEAPLPLQCLEASGRSFLVNPLGKRMTPEEVLETASGAAGLIAGVEPYSRDTMTAMPNLKAISRCGVGVDSIDHEAARELGVAVLNTPQPPIDAVAELTLSFILALVRELPALNASTHADRWQRRTGR